QRPVLITAAACENDEFLAIHDVDAIAPIIAIHGVVGEGRAAHGASPGEWDVVKPVIVPGRNKRVSHSNSPSAGSGNRGWIRSHRGLPPRLRLFWPLCVSSPA